MPNEFVTRNGLIAQNNSTISGSLTVTGGITGSISSASYAISALYAVSASYSPSTTSFPFTGSAIITGSLVVTGSTSINGTLTAVSIIETSAKRYKENIQNLDSADNIYKLRPVTFDWKSNQKNDIGFIAEEVNKIIPMLAEINENGEVEGVKYSKLTTLLTKALQIHEQQIQSLIEEINILKKEII